jgi:hypothetical protein
MRRFGAIVASALLTVLGLQSGGLAAALGPSVAHESWVSALWLEKTNEPNRYKMYTASVIEQTDLLTGDVRRLGSVVRGYCRKKQLGEDHYFACNGSGPSVTVRDRLEVAADGSSALLVVRRGDREWRVKWEASGSIAQSGVYQSQEGCTNGQGAGAGITRRTKASAHIFGRRMTSDPATDLGVTSIWKGGAATTCAPGLTAHQLRSLSRGRTIYIPTA